MNASTDLMHTLAWSLLHFLWQGTAIAAVTAALYFVFRKPATRYLIGVSALGLMLLSFAVTFSMLSRGDIATTTAWAPAAVHVSPQETFSTAMSPNVAGQAANDSGFDFAWLARGWLLGVFGLALRIAFGLFVLEQLRRRNLVALPDAVVARFRALQARLGIQRIIEYAECTRVSVPAVIGFFRPVVLIPVRALTGLSPEQLDALVAHELGHIKRFDVAVNFAQVIAETLLFFHPAVWWLNQRIRADREDCCDDIAVAAGGSSVRYAKALATVATWRDVPTFALAATGGPVAKRVARLLGMQDRDARAGMVTATLVLAGALIAGAVSFGFANPAQAQAPAVDVALPVVSATPVISATPVVNATPVIRAVPQVNAAIRTSAMVAVTASVATHPVIDVQPVTNVQPTIDIHPVIDMQPNAIPAVKAPPPPPPVAPPPAHAPGPPPPKAGEEDRTSYIEDIRTELGDDIGVDQLIALKNQDVTQQYVRDMRATGLKLSLDQLIAMKVHGVTPEYVKQVRAMGYDVNSDELIAFKVHGLSSEYVSSMSSLGFKANADEIIAMKVHDVTPEYVKQMRADGFQMNTDELISLKVHDVTPAFRKSLESAGLKVNTDQVIMAKVMDITPEFIAKVNAHGFKNLNLDKLIALKNADVL